MSLQHEPIQRRGRRPARQSVHAAAVGDGPRLELRRRGLCAELSAHGELDLASAGALEELLDRAPLRAGAVILLDLTTCTFIDSSIVALLLRWDEHARSGGGELVVLVAPGAVRATLAVTGVLDRLNVAEDGRRPRALP